LPNWNHNTLTITGPEPAIEFFRDQAKTDEQPLSFDRFVPEPTEEEYAAMDAARKTATCRLCGGRGKRPATQEEADGWEVPFYPQAQIPDVPFDDRPPCNSCEGTGKTFPPGESGSWYEWRLSNWGCKWDASFGGPFIALGGAEMDVEASVEALGGTITPTCLIYKFDTPWGPPTEFLHTIAPRFPSLSFELKYGEPGNDFAGRIVYEKGEFVLEEDLPVDEVLMPEEQWF